MTCHQHTCIHTLLRLSFCCTGRSRGTCSILCHIVDPQSIHPRNLFCSVPTTISKSDTSPRWCRRTGYQDTSNCNQPYQCHTSQGTSSSPPSQSVTQNHTELCTPFQSIPSTPSVCFQVLSRAASTIPRCHFNSSQQEHPIDSGNHPLLWSSLLGVHSTGPVSLPTVQSTVLVFLPSFHSTVPVSCLHMSYSRLRSFDHSVNSAPKSLNYDYSAAALFCYHKLA